MPDDMMFAALTAEDTVTAADAGPTAQRPTLAPMIPVPTDAPPCRWRHPAAIRAFQGDKPGKGYQPEPPPWLDDPPPAEPEERDDLDPAPPDEDIGPLHGGRSLTLADGHPANERRHRTLCRDRGVLSGHRGRQTDVLDAGCGIRLPIEGTVHRYVQLPDRAAKADAT